MFDAVLCSNRGEIAVRIFRTLKRLGIRAIAVYSDADADSTHVAAADAAYALGGSSAGESYLNIEKVISAAKSAGAQAIIPGYGFLSESAEFAEAVIAAGITFVGPTPEQLRSFGLKHVACRLAATAGVPAAVGGAGLLPDADSAVAAAAAVGYPVMLKSTAGGGGIGLKRCADEPALRAAFADVVRLAERNFGDAGVFIERCVDSARHIEVQIFGDGAGGCFALGERDCSAQRRNQKVLEETPAPGLPPATRSALLAAAVRLCASVRYRGAGTVEFLYDSVAGSFTFLEVNARLQVEHGITEAVTGLDLVELQLRVAAAERDFDLGATIAAAPPAGAAIEARLYAEEPLQGFHASPGTLTRVVWPATGDARVDTWVATGTVVGPHYDPLLAKVIVRGRDRPAALAALAAALAATRLDGISTNLPFLRYAVADARFAAGGVTTRWMEPLAATFAPAMIEVISPGTATSVQSLPGRMGLWAEGVPPSGPMDAWAAVVANRIVGNAPGAALLEATLAGPTLRVHTATLVAITGADLGASVDGAPVPLWQPVWLQAGALLALGKARPGGGARAYVAFRGGIDVPEYLGSTATFALAGFGGHGGRLLRRDDVLPLSDPAQACPAALEPRPLAPALIPAYGVEWTVAVLPGPHGAPDFFTPASIDALHAAAWTVHHNSNRMGVRLVGPRPEWARADGGDAGLHPSNIHDCEYALGSVNFTGDHPVILTVDGPSLGGFVCPVTIVEAELWKVGQLRPGDRLRFRAVTYAEARSLARAAAAVTASLLPVDDGGGAAAGSAGYLEPHEPSAEQGDAYAGGDDGAMLGTVAAGVDSARVVYRQAGDRYILVEYGECILDLALRLRVHELSRALAGVPGIEELAPGVRSLQVRFDPRRLHQRSLLLLLRAAEATLLPAASVSVPSRVLYLPLAWEDPATLGAVARYAETVRPDGAPWLPSNVEFIRRMNGLASVDDVRQAVFDATYLVLGLGDVYLGAPCAVPLDPRHRLVTSKYNPARSYTAEGTVGIGGVYMCIYGMDSPGGYQLVGRTLPIWDRHGANAARAGSFEAGKPWLLRFFDQVRFYPVSAPELDALRADFRAGRLAIRADVALFSLAEHERFVASVAPEVESFRAKQAAAFHAEVVRWRDEADASAASTPASTAPEPASPVPDEAGSDVRLVTVRADISGSVWKVLVAAGQRVAAGDVLIALEAMKCENAVCSEAAGVVLVVLVQQGATVEADAPLVQLLQDSGPSS